MKTAAQLLNRTITKKTGNKTAYELWTDKRPDLNNLHVFGSTAHIPSTNRKKWDAKARKALFVGYQGLSDNFKLYDEQTKKFFFSKNVKFDTEIQTSDNKFAVIQVNTKKKADQQQTKDNEVSDEDNKATEEKSQEKLISESNYHKKLRKPEERKAVNRYEAYLVDDCENITYDEAIKSDDRDKWEAAVKEEAKAHEKNVLG